MDTPARRPAPADKERRAAVRAGLFMVIAIVAIVIVIVVLGSAHHLFERHANYVVYFTDVDGLLVDSPVRLGGLSVGSVDAITFSPDAKDTRVKVRVKVASAHATRIRSDSVARVGSRGLLGDKTVDISVGSGLGAPVDSGGELAAATGNDVNAVLKASAEVVDNLVGISKDVRRAVSVYAAPEVSDELTQAMKSLRGILDEVATGQGAAHALIYDSSTGNDVRALVKQATQVATRLDAAVLKVDALLDEVRTGTGTAHALVYGTEGKTALVELGGAANEVATLIRTMRDSKGSAVSALLVGESKALVDDLQAAANSLKVVTAQVEHGEGSLGALVNDPTAYEDLKTILGNVKRNRLLRELVRLTISNRAEYTGTGAQKTPAAPEKTP